MSISAPDGSWAAARKFADDEKTITDDMKQHMAKKIIPLLLSGLVLAGIQAGAARKPVTDYVDPTIGTLNTGNVYIGPCCPFGMVKPSPDVFGSNPGWAPMEKPIYGFSQLHVSGTGGAPKYGNVLLMPFSEGMYLMEHQAMREQETIELGYYAATLAGSGIKVEITSAERAALYRLTYPEGCGRGLEVDAGICLKSKSKASQTVLDGEVNVVSDTEIEGYTVAEGGWGGGRAYTVYFCMISDTPVTHSKQLFRQVNLGFDGSNKEVNLKVGISFVSIEQARKNAIEYLPDWNFEATRERLVAQWDNILGRVKLSPFTSWNYRKMFYTALYHSMLMPSCRTGEWTKAAPGEQYYDDFFTLWDIYRTSLPMITILDPKREADIVSSLVNIYKHDGYMPDGRSGNSNGATQGSSNAEIVIADAYVKGLDGIDWETALEAMLKDAEIEPENPRYEGRGGLEYYKALGYIPWGIRRAGNRTVDGSYCDYAISVLAEGLGRKELAEKYRQRSHNWQNLWRDYEEDGMRGFIMPRDAEGNWLDEGIVDRSEKGLGDTLVTIKPSTSFHRWENFFYEANSYETSVTMPHDMDRLIEACGGKEAFKQRLDTYFSKAYCDPGNEPSFLTTSLYHWVGRPDLTFDNVARLIEYGYNDTAEGLPGNDDSGAMSSWLAFHMMGLYPVAATDYYLVHTPFLKDVSIAVGDGKYFRIKAKRLSEKRKYIKSAKLDGKDYPFSTIRHKNITDGCRLVLKMSSRPGEWGGEMFPADK